MSIEENYRIKERSESIVKKHGTVQNALSFLKNELEEMESLWSKYSCDCLGQGITCTRLLISALTK